MDLLNTINNKRTSIQILGIIVLVGVLFFPSIEILWGKWVLWDQDLAHAIPTLGVLSLFIWRLAPDTHRPDSRVLFWLTIAALAFISLSWSLLQSLNMQLPAYICLIALIILFIAASYSIYTAIQVTPIIGLLVFVIPLWSEANDGLVHLSAYIVGNLVAATHMTALIEGNSILIPSGTIYIAGGCSGLRYLTISLLMGYIIILLNRYTLRQAIITLLIAILLGLLANWIRIFALVLIGYHTEMQSSLMRDHETFGWILFAVIMMPAIYFAPMKHVNAAIKLKAPTFKPIIPAIFLAIGPALLAFTPTAQINHNPLNLAEFESKTTASKPKLEIAINQPKQANLERKYINFDGLPVRLDLATYSPSQQGEKLVPYLGSLINASDWITQYATSWTSNNNGSFRITVLKQVGGLQKIAVIHQFNIGDNTTNSYFKAKLLQMKAKLQGQAYFGLLSIQTSCEGDCNNEVAILKNVASDWQAMQESHNP